MQAKGSRSGDPLWLARPRLSQVFNPGSWKVMNLGWQMTALKTNWGHTSSSPWGVPETFWEGWGQGRAYLCLSVPSTKDVRWPLQDSKLQTSFTFHLEWPDSWRMMQPWVLKISDWICTTLIKIRKGTINACHFLHWPLFAHFLWLFNI